MLGFRVNIWTPSVIGVRSGSSPSLLSLHSRAVFEGDSITAGSNGPTYIQFALIKSMGRFFCPSGYNQATGGQTAAQMATQVSSITTLSPKVVVLLAGTNDLSGSGDTPAEIFANIRSCIEGYQAAGAQVVNICVLPRNDTTWQGLSRETDRQSLNDLIRSQTDVTVVDLEESFDPDTMAVDGLHPNYSGAILIGNAVGDAMNTLIVSDSILTLSDSSTDNFLFGADENPALTGTTGTKSGTNPATGEVASKWTVTENGGMTVVASKTTLNGRDAQRIVVSGTNSTNGRVVNFTNTVAYSGQAGEFWESWFDFSLASGSANLTAIRSSTDTAATPNGSQTNIMPSSAIAGVLRPAMTSALSGSDTSVSIQATLFFAAGTVSADITWAAPFYRKVPINQ